MGPILSQMSFKKKILILSSTLDRISFSKKNHKSRSREKRKSKKSWKKENDKKRLLSKKRTKRWRS